MKTIKIFAILMLLASISTSCLRDSCTATRNYVRFNPVYMTGHELEYDVSTLQKRTLINPGKLYYYKNHLFINEQGQGVHIYDNSDPENPQYKVFYNLPGNFDIAIKNDVMYADNPLYLMALDISDLANPKLIDRKKMHDYDWYYDNKDNQHVIYYTRSNVVETIDCSDNNFNTNWFWREDAVFVDFGRAEGMDLLSSTANSGSISGVGGSMARFTLYDDYLYTVDHSSLNVWDLSNASSPEKIGSKMMGWGIETIFPYKDKLFIGSATGMFIFDNSNPSNPIQTAQFNHAAACDPVVVTDERAYVTLRDGNECAGFVNQLDVIDITNLYNPSLIKSYEMRHPHGLAIRNDHLFICEGTYGLKIFDASDDLKITNNQVAYLDQIHAFDVISLSEEVLFVVGEGGFFQYNVSDPTKPQLISSILTGL